MRAVVVAVALLGACATTGRQTLRQVVGFDSYSSACGNYPAQCAAAAGKEGAAAAGAASAAGVYRAAQVVASVIDRTLLERIEQALKECVDLARSEVLVRNGFKSGPTREDCNEVVGKGNRGEPVTRAMQMGLEMHEVAARCAQERLSLVKPGGFRIEQRYRYDPVTGVVTPLSKVHVDMLIREGRAAELSGTLVPDVVIHEEGNPARVQEVYDFKTPCKNTDEPERWRQYQSGPYYGRSQGDVYGEAFRPLREPATVQPHIGVTRQPPKGGR